MKIMLHAKLHIIAKIVFNNRRTIKQNICQQSIDKWGYVDFNITFNNFKTKWYSYPITLASFVVVLPLFVGVDTFWHNHIFEAEISIYNAKKSLIKKYTISDEVLTKSGLTNWKRNNPRLSTARYFSDIKVMNSIMDKLSVEISIPGRRRPELVILNALFKGQVVSSPHSQFTINKPRMNKRPNPQVNGLSKFPIINYFLVYIRLNYKK